MSQQSQKKTTTGRQIVQVEYPVVLADRLSQQAKREMLTRSALLRRISAEYVNRQEGAGHERKAA